jgi:hypothetical protein
MKWTKDAVQEAINKIYEDGKYASVVAERLATLCETIQADMAAEIADLQEMLNVSDKAVAETILANQ